MKPREYGESDRAHCEAKPNRDRPVFATQIFERIKDAEDLQGERHGRRDRNESADRIDRDCKSDVGDVARFQFFQGAFFHIRFILSYNNTNQWTISSVGRVSS